jgi:hypothetical protein
MIAACWYFIDVVIGDSTWYFNGQLVNDAQLLVLKRILLQLVLVLW